MQPALAPAQNETRAERSDGSSSSPIHATNAWNPTGRNLDPIPGTRLFYAHADALNGPRTFVLLGNQRHLTFVADLEGHVDPTTLRSTVIDRFGLYPHLVDIDPAPGLPRLFDEQKHSPK